MFTVPQNWEPLSQPEKSDCLGLVTVPHCGELVFKRENLKIVTVPQNWEPLFSLQNHSSPKGGAGSQFSLQNMFPM